MGTHPSNPSVEHTSGRPLSRLLEHQPQLLSASVVQRYGGASLPSLFKVLSIRKALSIQAHPDKALAARLHATDPKNYPDANHKPEMAIAITPFDGFCGFRPLAEIVAFLDAVEPLRRLVGEDAAAEFISAVRGKELSAEPADMHANRAALRKLYTKLMTASHAAVESCSDALIALAKAQPGTTLLPSRLLLRLDGQFPADIGLFSTFMLNHVTLRPGEAIFLRANEPHAYLSGDIMECMATSDNVVRAGFTPKFKDITTLVDMLTYSYSPPENQMLVPKPYPGTAHSLLYDPPIDEFSVLKTALVAPGETEVVPAIDGPSLLIVENGKGTVAVGPKNKQKAETGWVFFVGAGAEVEMQAEEGGFVVYRAFCEVN